MNVRACAGGIVVELRVRPRSRPGWGIGVEGDLVLAVAAPPVAGAATEAARRALAKVLDVAPSRVTLHRGERHRRKAFVVSGVGVEEATAALARAAGGYPAAGGGPP